MLELIVEPNQEDLTFTVQSDLSVCLTVKVRAGRENLVAEFADMIDVVTTEVALRSKRNTSFGSELFHELGWDILLHLYVAHHLERALTKNDILEEVKASEQTGTRWLKYLVAVRLVETLDDKIVLSQMAIDKIESLCRLMISNDPRPSPLSA